MSEMNKFLNAKIGVVSASPRKGRNSDLLCYDFIKAAQESIHNAEIQAVLNIKTLAGK
jgi:multimeric flavodoxin WrbA